MELIQPKFLALDTSTLAKVSHDFSNRSEGAKRKARQFIDDLTGQGVHITLTFTHVCEFLRHENDGVVRGRLDFLRQLPLLAWLRPYAGDWMPGCAVDLFRYELHAFVHRSLRSWSEIVDVVRSNVFETATGAEMFIDGLPVWEFTRQMANNSRESEMQVSAVGRSDPLNVKKLTMKQISRMPLREPSVIPQLLPRFARTMQQQIEKFGDPRFQDSRNTAIGFTQELAQDIAEINTMGGDPRQGILKQFGVPSEMVRPEMTVEEISELCAYFPYVRKLGKSLNPRAIFKVGDVPIDSLPSHVLTRNLDSLQKTAARVKGSDFGDRMIAPLLLYVDAMEVDKRTLDYLTRICTEEKGFNGLIGKVFRSIDYSAIPGEIG